MRPPGSTQSASPRVMSSVPSTGRCLRTRGLSRRGGCRQRNRLAGSAGIPFERRFAGKPAPPRPAAALLEQRGRRGCRSRPPGRFLGHNGVSDAGRSLRPFAPSDTFRGIPARHRCAPVPCLPGGPERDRPGAAPEPTGRAGGMDGPRARTHDLGRLGNLGLGGSLYGGLCRCGRHRG